MTVRLFSFSRNKNNFCFFCYCSSYFYKFLGIHYMARVYVFCMGVSALWMPIIKNNSKLAAKMINIWNWMCDCIEMITCTTLRHCKYKRDRKKAATTKIPTQNATTYTHWGPHCESCVRIGVWDGSVDDGSSVSKTVVFFGCDRDSVCMQ